VFLDRDGVLVRPRVIDGRPYPPTGLQDFELLPGVEDACRALRESGFLLVVVTNQPDIARGMQSSEMVEQMHDVLRERLKLDDIRVCPHDDADHCRCRKPEPGMVLDAAAALDVDLGTSYLVGDRWRDVEAAARAGCRAIFVGRGYAEGLPDSPHLVAEDLLAAVPLIVGGSARRALHDA
jgi:D-glycero-D-manno-heptose 1,7-bisphosphate phosphatase